MHCTTLSAPRLWERNWWSAGARAFRPELPVGPGAALGKTPGCSRRGTQPERRWAENPRAGSGERLVPGVRLHCVTCLKVVGGRKAEEGLKDVGKKGVNGSLDVSSNSPSGNAEIWGLTPRVETCLKSYKIGCSLRKTICLLLVKIILHN